jgi:hypothetical protein
MRLMLLLLFVFTACTPIPEDDPVEDLQDRPDQVFWDGTITVLEKELVRVRLSAGRMEQFRREAIVRMMDSVRVTTWDSLGRVESILACDTLHYNRNRMDMQAIGHVRVHAASDPEGRRLDTGRDTAREEAELLARPPFLLLTSELEWVQRIQKIRSEKQVVFYTPLDTLRGKGFRSDRNLRNWEIDSAAGVSHRRSGESP